MSAGRYSPVWNTKPLDTPVDGQHVRYMSVVEPESRCVDQDSPVVGVTAFEEIVQVFLDSDLGTNSLACDKLKVWSLTIRQRRRLQRGQVMNEFAQDQ